MRIRKQRTNARTRRERLHTVMFHVRRRRGGKVPLSTAPNSDSGSEFKLGQICVEQLTRYVTFKDPESVKILSQPRKLGADLIDWNGIRVEALQFRMVVDAKNSYGAYSGGDDYRCDTSLDGRRIFSIRKR